jgi:hypothetical protein
MATLCEGAGSPYSDFQAMSLDDLKTLQVKLTYLGPRKDILSTVAFTSTFNTLDLSKFVPFRQPGFDYDADDLSVQTFSASPAELKAVIDNVAMLPAVTAGGVASPPYLSFMLLNTLGSTKVFEAILSKADTADLFAKLRLALASNKDGLRKLNDMACPLGVLESGTPTDVSAQVGVTLGGVRINRATGRFVGTATLKNNSAVAIAGPVSLLLDLPGSVSLFNSDGTTCGTTPRGREFINVPAGLAAGASAQLTLEFNNPDSEAIKPTTKVLAGPGAR